MGPPLLPVSDLDAAQIIQHAFNEATQQIRVEASVTASIVGEVAVEIDAADGDNIAIANADGSLKATITTIGSDNGLDVNVIGGSISGTFTPVGLSTGVKHDRIPVGAVAVPLTSLLVGRNSVSFRVVGPSVVYIGDATVTGPSGANPGYPKFVNEEIIGDITGAVTFYAVCDTGQSSEIASLEI